MHGIFCGVGFITPILKVKRYPCCSLFLYFFYFKLHCTKLYWYYYCTNFTKLFMLDYPQQSSIRANILYAPRRETKSALKKIPSPVVVCIPSHIVPSCHRGSSISASLPRASTALATSSSWATNSSSSPPEIRRLPPRARNPASCFSLAVSSSRRRQGLLPQLVEH
jgi:hypothetical protein